MKAIEICHLTHDYGSHKGVFDLSLAIEKGEVFGFLGPNGAGKTTTIRHLMGFIKADQGQCRINGLDCWSQSNIIQKNVGYIPGEISYFDDMSGLQYLCFIAGYRGMKSVERRDELIKFFAVDLKAKIKKMSKGMKQKIGIIAAFMHDPSIIILDEPTSGLDPLMQNRFIELIKNEQSKGKTILMSSHIFEEVERTCDRIGIIKDGKLAALDSTANLKQKHVHSFVVTLADHKEAIAFAKFFNGVIVDTTKVRVDAKESLEDIFLNYYGGK